tara:strand:+ start:38537 stop:39349 length:813 start_codon:yes stop_codon:yes gene_type:complete
MWFTKDSTGFRGWFSVIDSKGNLRTGMIPSDFIATIVDGDDSATDAFVVAESTQKAGFYYFNVTSAFLLANGIGDYGVVVQIDSSVKPKIRTAFSKVLNVAEKDLNDIAGATTITDIQTSLNNVENIVTDIESDVSTIFATLISEQFTVIASTSLSEGVIPTGNADYPDDFFNGQLVIWIGTLGTAPIILARTISDYTSDGTIFVSPDFPLAPSAGDQMVVLARTATAAVDNNAIANAVWTIATTPTTVGSYGELVNIIGNRTSLIPGLI